ncbi:MAG: alanine racemase [Clostridia bacterium]|nr:alanine racemase [Clostridia bacterium]
MQPRKHIRTVDLAQLRRNVALLRAALPEQTQLMAVVKADAYGHGMIPVARESLRAGASQLAVAITEEGVQLRRQGVTAPILVLGALTPNAAQTMVDHHLTATVCHPDMIRTLQDAAEAARSEALVHLKIDSGMCRIGCRTEDEVAAMIAALQQCPRVKLTGAYTHFADADNEDLAFTRQQFDRFMTLIAPLPEGILRHCANSAAIHVLPEAALDMVRAGISMYGYPPVATDMPLRPCMNWTTEITYVKDIMPGDTVSYGRAFTADKPMRVATIACGYGDGYHRAASGQAKVIIHGQYAPVLGRICMDQMMADVTHIPEAQSGSTVILMGEEGDCRLTAEDIAAWAGTISYEVLLGATGRVTREWLHASE